MYNWELLSSYCINFKHWLSIVPICDLFHRDWDDCTDAVPRLCRRHLYVCIGIELELFLRGMLCRDLLQQIYSNFERDMHALFTRPV